jgi:DegV family protein with EDD domain
VTGVAVVTDSACDLPADVSERHGIHIVPLTVVFGTRSYLDRVDLQPEEFWSKAAETFPTTASPPPQAFLDAYERAAAEGASGVVSVHLSAELSRTAVSAGQASALASIPVEVVDSRSVSLGQGLVAVAAADAARTGMDVREVAAAARSAATRLTVAVVLETVEFLKRGGRVGRARAALSELLRIRPVLSLDGGEPILAARARTRVRALDALLGMLPGEADAAALFHSGAAEAEVVAGRVEETCGIRPLMALIGPVTGSHLGPGALGVAVLRPPLD